VILARRSVILSWRVELELISRQRRHVAGLSVMLIHLAA